MREGQEFSVGWQGDSLSKPVLRSVGRTGCQVVTIHLVLVWK